MSAAPGDGVDHVVQTDVPEPLRIKPPSPADVFPLVFFDGSPRELVRVSATGDVIYRSVADLEDAVRIWAGFNPRGGSEGSG